MTKGSVYYVTGNTSEGFVNFLESNVKDIKNVFVLKHESEIVKSEVIKNIIKDNEKNSRLEILYSPLGRQYLDGVILREKSIAVVSDTIVASLHHSSITEVDLHLYFGEGQIDEDLQNKIQNVTEQAYESFATGLKIHDDLEKIYIDQMDFERADQFADEFIAELLQSQSKQQNQGKIYRRLFGTNTPDGVVNVVPQIIAELSNVYFIKGRAGTGKSTFMKKIAKACIDRGLDVEIYRCSFDPKSLDMVIARDLDFCIFDSTDPHEFFPNRDGERIVDLYKELVAPGTDEKYAEQINRVNQEYKSYMKKGIEYLKEAGACRERLEKSYTPVDKEKINDIVDTIFHK